MEGFGVLGSSPGQGTYEFLRAGFLQGFPFLVLLHLSISKLSLIGIETLREEVAAILAASLVHSLM